MGHQLKRQVSATELARALGLPCHGSDLTLDHVASLPQAAKGSLCFAKALPDGGLPEGAVVIAPGPGDDQAVCTIVAANPRLAFARALHILDAEPGFRRPAEPARIHPSARVSPTAVLGAGIVIGARTVIEHHVVLADGVVIGDDCHIKSNTVIGEAGFGFERDEQGIPVRLLHLGGVVIGNRVEIGSLNTVCRATLGLTVVEDDVKTDDHVHIAHNCRVRRGALLTACTELSGGVDVGEFVWIGPNSSVIQKAVLGDHAFIGIGANVTKSVEPHAKVAGNPAKALRERSSQD